MIKQTHPRPVQLPSFAAAIPFAVCLALASVAQAQAPSRAPASTPASAPAEPPVKPFTQAELLKTLDNIGKGDPVTKAPLSAQRSSSTPATPRLELPVGSATPKPKKEKEKEKPAAADANDPNARSKPGETEITSEEGAFDQKKHQAVFKTNVFVKNPDFTLSCDQLTAYMKHDDAKPGSRKSAEGTNPNNRPPTVVAGSAQVLGPDGKPVAPPPGANDKAGGLDKALAEGNVVITQDKIDENGNMTHNIGRAKWATYDSASGDVVLHGMPEVEQGINTCEALDEETTITLNRNGQMKTKGRTKNTIRENTTQDKLTQDKSTQPNGR